MPSPGGERVVRKNKETSQARAERVRGVFHHVAGGASDDIKKKEGGGGNHKCIREHRQYDPKGKPFRLCEREKASFKRGKVSISKGGGNEEASKKKKGNSGLSRGGREGASMMWRENRRGGKVQRKSYLEEQEKAVCGEEFLPPEREWKK